VLDEAPPRPSCITDDDRGQHDSRFGPADVSGQQDPSARMGSEHVDPTPIPVVIEADLGQYLPAEASQQAYDITLERCVDGVDEAIELLAVPAHLDADGCTQRVDDAGQACQRQPRQLAPFDARHDLA